MGGSKYSKFLTVILIIVVIGVFGLLGYLGIDVYKKFANKKEVAQVLDEYDNTLNTSSGTTTGTNSNVEMPDVIAEPSNTIGGATGTQSTQVKYKGYNVEGKIEIPAIDLEYPILEKTTPTSIEAAVAIMYSANGLNQPGNTVIAGHNYRNGDFFGNNDKLKLRDK